MWNRKASAAFALIALASWACSPDDYPSAPRFEPPPEVIELPDGELFFFTPPAGVTVTSVSVPGIFNNWTPGVDEMVELPDGRWVAGIELEPGTYMYKYHFNGTTWAGNMCNDAAFGDPANGGQIDPDLDSCTEGGDAIRTVGTPGHTFLYIVPEGVDVEVVTVAGSFQDPVWTNTTDTLTNIWEYTVDLEPGTYNYKYVFNDGGWASNMCTDADWGNPLGGRVDPDNDEACTGGGDGTLTIEEAGPHTFRYIVPAGADSIAQISVAGSFQDPVWQPGVDFMQETFQRRYDIAPGSYEYKFIFDGNWAASMCTNDTWAGGGVVDANGSGECNGENAILVIE